MKDLGYKGRVMAADLEGNLTVISEILSPVFSVVIQAKFCSEE